MNLSLVSKEPVSNWNLSPSFTKDLLALVGETIHEPTLVATAVIRRRVSGAVLLVHFHVAALARFGFIDANKNVGLALFRFGQLLGLLHIIPLAHPP